MEQPKKKKSWFLKWVVALAIIIVLNLFFNYAIQLLYPAPDHEDFCVREQVTIVPDNKEDCVAGGGAWTEDRNIIEFERAVPQKLELTEENKGWCDIHFTCRKNFEVARSLYNRNVFVALMILGLVSIGASFFAKSAEAVSLGLSLGGVLSLVIGSMRYWSDMDGYLRVIILGIALIVLIWLGIKKFRD